MTSDPYPVPKEVWFLVDHLYRHGLKQEHLFEQSGLKSEFIQIRNWLDSGTPDSLRTVLIYSLIYLNKNLLILSIYIYFYFILAGSVHSVAEALLILLDSTSEPIIPYNLHATCLSVSSYYAQCKQVSISST